ncbi:MAG: hypothetical protein K2X52_00285 [Mycobacteriaceae bacterium]|jgi:hypothetical protein|nr:hypothetical protein [Mycobacteriaceae bacterium]
MASQDQPPPQYCDRTVSRPQRLDLQPAGRVRVSGPNTSDGKHAMQQFTEDEVAARVGLPGPIIAELIQPAVPTAGSLADARRFGEADVIRAQVAALMLAYGVRWHWVHTAMQNTPTHPDALRAALDFWTDVVPSPHNPRNWPLPATALASALMVLALLVGILLGMQLTAGAPL